MPMETGGTEGVAATTTAAAGATSSGGGATGAGGGGNTPAPGTSGGLAGAMQQAASAAGVTQPQPAAGQPGQATPVAGQPAPTQQPQSPADIKAALAAHPQLAAQYAAWEQQAAENARWATWAQQKYQEEQQARQRQGNPNAPAEQPKHIFGVPEFDKRLMQFMRRDENGQIVPLPGCPPLAIQQYQQWEEARRQAVEKIIDNPREALAPLFEEFKQQLLTESRQIAGGTLQQAQQTAFANNFVEANKGWLYQLDARGNPQVNPVTGKRVLSEVGQLYHDAVGEIDPQGQMPLEKVHGMAMRMVRGELAIRQAATQQQQGQQAAAAGQSFIQRAAAAGQQQPALPGGQQQPPAPAAQPQGGPPQRLLSRMRQNAEAAGVLVHGTY